MRVWIAVCGCISICTTGRLQWLRSEGTPALLQSSHAHTSVAGDLTVGGERGSRRRMSRDSTVRPVECCRVERLVRADSRLCAAESCPRVKVNFKPNCTPYTEAVSVCVSSDRRFLIQRCRAATSAYTSRSSQPQCTSPTGPPRLAAQCYPCHNSTPLRRCSERLLCAMCPRASRTIDNIDTQHGGQCL